MLGAVLLWSMVVVLGVGANVLEPLELPGVGHTGVHTLCDDCSDTVQFNTSVPFGDYCHSEAHISVNGIITFGESVEVFTPESFPGIAHNVFFGYIVAPFWADADITHSGSITWEILSGGESETSDQILSQISQFISNHQNTNFTGNWTMIVNFVEIPEYLSLVPANTNSYQAIIITDGEKKSYAIYTYQCPQIKWGDSAVVGFNAAGDYSENYNGTTSVINIDCSNWPSFTNNVVYDLVPNPNKLRCFVPTPEPPTSIGSCKVSGYTECCRDTTCLDRLGECYCDSTCYFFNDCCRDIDNFCTPENFTLGETYLLVASSGNIARMSVAGSRLHDIYTKNSSSYEDVVGIDFDYSDDRMYWSTNGGRLNRAYLNGSNPEVIYTAEDPSIEDIAIDWISKKLYWTEEGKARVRVLDLNTGQTRTLIANYNTSKTRAIAVDPTTRYMYWSDWGNEARIERSSMDGSDRTVLHDTEIILPNSLTLDIPEQRLYWIDAYLDVVEYSLTNGSGRAILQKINDRLFFHPFGMTLAGEFLFWTDWLGNTVSTTHKDRAEDNVVQLMIDARYFSLHGIEAISADRQPEVDNPCATATCNSSSMCLLSTSSVSGYACVCADGSTDCSDDVPTPFPTEPPSSSRGLCVYYSGCCDEGDCRGRDFVSGAPAACTCDIHCLQRGDCCNDIIFTCPRVYRLCSAAGYSQCCPAGSGCANSLSSCSCDEDCFENNNCCQDTLNMCHNPTPGKVTSLQARSSSATSLVISWTGPPSNGRPLSFTITVTISSGDIITTKDTSSLSISVDELEPEVPYYVKVVSVSGLSTGEPSDIVAFTREGTPSVAPSSSLVWLSNSELNVSWTPLTLEEARGFPTSYVVSYTSTGKTKRQIEEDSSTVPGNKSSVVLEGLDASRRQYSVFIYGVTSAGDGVSSPRIAAPASAGVYFQLHILDIPSCEKWRSVSEKMRQDSIIDSILSAVKDLCDTCDLKANDITSIELSLHCREEQITASFRALLIGNPQQNELISNNLEKWVEVEDEAIDFGDFTAKLNPQCDVAIETFSDDFCSVKDQPTEMTPVSSDSSSNQDSDNTTAIIIPVVVVVILIIICVAILITIIIFFRKRNTQKADPYLNFERHEATETARLSQTYEDETEKEFQNPLYVVETQRQGGSREEEREEMREEMQEAEEEEQEEEITKTDLERQYLENPDILK